MRPIFINIQPHLSGPALFAEYIRLGGEVYFVSDSEDTVTIKFPEGQSPLNSDTFLIQPGETIREQVRDDAEKKPYPFELTMPSGTYNLIIEVGDDNVTSIGFLFDWTGSISYLLHVSSDEEKLRVSIANHTHESHRVRMKPRLSELNEKHLPSEQSTAVLEVSRRTQGSALAVWLPDVSPMPTGSHSSPKLNIPFGQGGGTRQIEIIVDPEGTGNH